jgi:hypothetical protein
MPRAKRQLSEVSVNAVSASEPDRKKTSLGEQSEAHNVDADAADPSPDENVDPSQKEKNEDGDDFLKLCQARPHEYVCIHPSFDIFSADRKGLTDGEGEEQDDEDEDDEADAFNEAAEALKKFYVEPASKHPGYKWVMMRETWKIFIEYRDRSRYCDPDNFDMIVYNDFRAYGVVELLENMVSVDSLGLLCLLGLTFIIDRSVQRGLYQERVCRPYVVCSCSNRSSSQHG